ncbi:MAG: hypothetical protein ACR2JK_10405, partial [Geodermatophilaceae bacterium]
PFPLDDPIADRLSVVAASADQDPVRLVRGLLAVREVFGDDLAAHEGFRTVLVEQVGRLLSISGRPSLGH